MLDEILLFFQRELSTYIKLKTGGQTGSGGEEPVQFAKVQPPRDITMESNAISLLLINVEEERVFRSGSAQIDRLSGGGNSSGISNLALNLHVIFIANFNDYVQGLKHLSQVLTFFRSYRLFTQKNFPSLHADIHQLSSELVNLTFMEQSELWRSLEMPSSPSALYKIRMLVLQNDEIDQVEPGPAISQVEIETSAV
jgi:hypothetical protein